MLGRTCFNRRNISIWTDYKNDVQFDNGYVNVVISDSDIADMCNTGVSRADIEQKQAEWEGYDLVWIGSSYKGSL